MINMWQEDDSAILPVSMDARIRGLDYDRVSIDLFEKDPDAPGDLNASFLGTFGDYRPNFKDTVFVQGVYQTANYSLHGPDSLDGKFIAVRSAEHDQEFGEILGTCKISVQLFDDDS